MLISIEQFRNRIQTDLKGLIADLQLLTGRCGSEEIHAWENSLGKLDQVFRAPSFQRLHLFFGSRGNLALEYQLPASSSWCDVVLLGAHESKPSAVIIELKDWLTRNDKPGRYEGLIERKGSQELHPSDQVRGYTEYCRRFHSAVTNHHATVHGCVLFTRDHWAAAYGATPNRELAARYPLFTVSPGDVSERFPAFFKQRLTEPDEEFAHAFASGRYRQNRGFVAQIGAQILNPQAQVFELLDNQRKAFAVCSGIIGHAFLAPSSESPPKKVIIVKGPPGSGKSVIAARLWASLVTNRELPPGDVVFTTTSLSQNSNWADLFDRASGLEAASGVIRKATTYSPITTQRLGALRQKHGEDFLSDANTWRENLAALATLGEKWRDGAEDNQNLVSIVDEAHALINPEHRDGRGQFGFATTLGPQAYHIIRSSLLTVFLLDPLQSFRQRENTTMEDIRKWSAELGADEPEVISLDGAQFRCAGSTEYVTWIEAVLGGEDASTNRVIARRWYRAGERNFPTAAQELAFERMVAEEPMTYTTAQFFEVAMPQMDFHIFDNPEPWEAQLRLKHKEGSTVRILAPYSRKWKTDKAGNPHKLPPEHMDFHEPYEIEGKTKYWSRIWNFVPPGGSDYTWYVSGHPAGHIMQDPLCEVGCPYAVRGFDYDYVGILWLNDLIWKEGRWQVDPYAVEERGFKDLTAASRREAKNHQVGPATTELLERVVLAYRILFTRAIRGAYVWIPDMATRAYVVASLR